MLKFRKFYLIKHFFIYLKFVFFVLFYQVLVSIFRNYSVNKKKIKKKIFIFFYLINLY